MSLARRGNSTLECTPVSCLSLESARQYVRVRVTLHLKYTIYTKRDPTLDRGPDPMHFPEATSLPHSTYCPALLPRHVMHLIPSLASLHAGTLRGSPPYTYMHAYTRVLLLH